MPDTNKEREIERLESSLINYVPHLSDTPKRARKVAEILVELGYGFLGDRVGQTFTEEGFRAWATENGFLLHGPSVVRAVEFAATLQTQQPMGRAVLWIQKDQDTWIVTGPQFTDLQSSDDYAYGDTEEEALDSYFKMKRKPAPSHPVEGELTREWLEGVALAWEDDKTKIDEVMRRIKSDRPKLQEEVDFFREVSETKQVEIDHLFNELAATEARVREDFIESLRQRDTIMERQRATIADLTAKLETTVQIPPVEEWPEWAYCVRMIFEETALWTSSEDIGAQKVRQVQGSYRHRNSAPRPTPKTLTSEEKAEAVMRSMGYDPDSDIGRAAGESALYKAMLDGKSIDELYAEVKGGEK
jgi:hypothetical protein